MDGSRIMVLKLREVIKTAIFIIAGIALIVVLIYLVFPKDKAKENEQLRFTPGTYTATVSLNKGTADVSVTVSDDKILEITLLNMPEEQAVIYPLLKPTLEVLSTEILSKQTLDVSVPSDSIVTGQVLISAIDNALEKATVE